jgi:hypothetical protein
VHSARHTMSFKTPCTFPITSLASGCCFTSSFCQCSSYPRAAPEPLSAKVISSLLITVDYLSTVGHCTPNSLAHQSLDT